ncbi:N n-dimethylformamidase beta subunit [Fusarium sp. NRRL 52700]|nr:N n-dimethylformamidase beta subunit [Fusarium sp. NRRL 52700]
MVDETKSPHISFFEGVQLVASDNYYKIRSIGRPPNELWGIGSCSSGEGPGRPFFPTDEALNNPSLEWLWKCLDEESRKLLGTKGRAGGASGDELDRLDVATGSPANAILLARSDGHDVPFMLFNEELIFPMIGTPGSASPRVRSDTVYYEANGSGSVFSVGSN